MHIIGSQEEGHVTLRMMARPGRIRGVGSIFGVLRNVLPGETGDTVGKIRLLTGQPEGDGASRVIPSLIGTITPCTCRCRANAGTVAHTSKAELGCSRRLQAFRVCGYVVVTHMSSLRQVRRSICRRRRRGSCWRRRTS